MSEWYYSLQGSLEDAGPDFGYRIVLIKSQLLPERPSTGALPQGREVDRWT